MKFVITNIMLSDGTSSIWPFECHEVLCNVTVVDIKQGWVMFDSLTLG